MHDNENTVERNNYIDILKGIAALGIIAIHTAFWSGQSYTPEYFYNITLFLDVPFFFYLSGWASSYRKSDIVRTCKGLIQLWLKWIYFVIVLSIFCSISKYMFPNTFSGITNLKDLIYGFFFKIDIKGLPVVGGSIWYMPIYFVVIVGNTIAMMIIQKTSNPNIIKKTYMLLLAAGFIWVCFDNYFLGLDAKYYLFYSFFWMLGQNRMGKAKSYFHLACCILISLTGIVLSSYVFDIRLIDIQSAKFPPNIKYGFVSMITIYFATFGNNHVKNRFLSHIGRNAIFYYFGQGIGSSLIYFFVNSFTTKIWPLKWCIALGINIIITAFIAELLAKSYSCLFKIIVKLKALKTA